ncbi:MAG: glycosyltransferase [Firmicutes bacterium]|nr:glycosyltransferase [Bacillota bacterium]
MPNRTLVVVATYNEIATLPRLVEEVLRHAPDVDILVIDDNSPDGTSQWCESKMATEPRLRCMRREGKLGLGTALAAAMRARRNSACWLRAG